MAFGFSPAAFPAPAQPHDADAELQAIYTAEWTWRMAQLPDDEDSHLVYAVLDRCCFILWTAEVSYGIEVPDKVAGILHAWDRRWQP